jgi:hypothetical protein
MKRDDEVILEQRLTRLEMGIEQVKRNSDDRLETIMARFDKLDRRAAWWVNGIFAIALAAGGIYLEAYLNKDGSRDFDKPDAVELRDDP